MLDDESADDGGGDVWWLVMMKSHYDYADAGDGDCHFGCYVHTAGDGGEQRRRLVAVLSDPFGHLVVVDRTSLTRLRKKHVGVETVYIRAHIFQVVLVFCSVSRGVLYTFTRVDCSCGDCSTK